MLKCLRGKGINDCNMLEKCIKTKANALDMYLVIYSYHISAGKESTCSVGDGFNPWVGKIPWRRAWQPTPVFLPGEPPWTESPDGLQSMGSQSVRHD